jgi:hypothetical protein
MLKIKSQVININSFCLSLHISKKSLIEKTSKINLMKLIVLVKELSKLLLKYRFTKKESHNKNNNIKDLFLVKKKSFFLKE